MIGREIGLARSFFSREADGRWAMRNAFQNYVSDLSMSLRIGHRDDEASAQLVRHLSYVLDDLANIGTLMVRMAIITEQQRTGVLPPGAWFAFVALDIEHFHIELRSALDHVAEALATVATRPKNLPGRPGHRSFREFQDWLEKDASNANTLGSDLAELVRSAGWFPALLDIRDDTVHRGGRTLTFDDGKSGILFQSYSGSLFRAHVAQLGVMHNENTVDFTRYGALLFARLLNLLDALSRALDLRASTTPTIRIGDAFHLGPWEAFTRWADAILLPGDSKTGAPQWADVNSAMVIRAPIARTS